MFLENNTIEEILCTLDKEGYIFPGYEVVKINNKPNLLGRGGFSRVYEMNCHNRPEKKYVLRMGGFEEHVMTSEEFWNSIRLQNTLNEQIPYICRLISAKEICITLDDDGRLVQVREVKKEKSNQNGIYVQFILMEKLENIIERNRFGNVLLKQEKLINEDEVVDFAIQIGQALYYTHKNNILHRDVKLENIFWNAELKKYQLGDFGIATYTAEGRAETVAYTSGYGAPEMGNNLYDSYDATVDIYSLGITLYLLLNEFRFPGSEGYYVNMVQYNPEFVFPAPSRASERMVRIIRKMCQYYPEHRYRTMAEVLMDLKECKKNNREIEFNDEAELWDRETETYRDECEFPDFETVPYEDTFSDKAVEVVRTKELNGRAKRREDERIQKKVYDKFSMVYFIGLTVLITLLTGSLQTDSMIIQNIQFWIIPIMALIETILLRVKEFHIAFGIMTLVVGAVMCITMGVSVPDVILLCGIITGIPVISGACVSATSIWAVLTVNDKLQWINFIEKYDLEWILLVIVFCMMHHYWWICCACGKITYKWVKAEAVILNYIYWVMIAVGIILVILERFGTVQIPEIIQRFHLIRTGVVSLVFYLATKLVLFFNKE